VVTELNVGEALHPTVLIHGYANILNSVSEEGSNGFLGSSEWNISNEKGL
jgi:hypothetical protein